MNTKVIRLLLIGAVFSSLSFGDAIVAGFNTTSDGRNDDGTYTAPTGCTNPSSGGTCAGSLVSTGLNMNLFGSTFSSIYVNTNGNVTFDSPLATYTPFGLLNTSHKIIAPFFADVDTRNAGSGVVQFGTGMFDGHNAFGVDWINVGYYSSHADLTNSFQLLLVDRTDTGDGNFDIIFNYGNISWETGDASGGIGGVGGSSARVGWSNGSTASYELAGSAINGALLNGGANALITHRLNSDVSGRYIFFARNGEIEDTVPEPGSIVLLGTMAALVGLGCRRSLLRR